MPLKILVADDEDTLRSVITEVLTDDGHQVLPASSGEQALDAFETFRPDVVITELVMGKMSGLELQARIAELETDCMVIITTSNASQQSAIKAFRAGAYDFLNKPFDDLEVITTVVRRAGEKLALQRENENLISEVSRHACELEKANEKLEAMAQQDGLTGLYNHRFFRAALESEIARARRYDRAFALLFLDFDDFKTINDTRGHLVGDEVLREAGKLLREQARSSDIVARYGGEEFAVIATETGKTGALEFAERIRATISDHPFTDTDGTPVSGVTVSIGVAVFPEDATTDTDLIELADRALYRAKTTGRNRVRSHGDSPDQATA